MGATSVGEVLGGPWLPLEHVLVAHGPLVLGDGAASLRAAIGHEFPPLT